MDLRVSPSDRLNWAIALYAPAVLLLVSVPVAAKMTGNAPSEFTLDPAALAGAHPFLGVVSNVGILLWAGTAAISLFAAGLLQARDHEATVFLLSAGLLTTWLLLDDFFLFHEWLFPRVLGVQQTSVLLVYVILMMLFLYRFGAFILRTDYLFLALALVFFAGSVGIDQFPSEWFAWEYLYLIEDGAKLLGIVSWFAYFVSVCARRLSAARQRTVDQLAHI